MNRVKHNIHIMYSHFNQI